MSIPGSINPLFLGAAGQATGGKKVRVMPDYAFLKDCLTYYSETGDFFRAKTTSSNAKKGDKSGYYNKRGYLLVTVGNKKYLAHRLAWYYMTGEDPGEKKVDHINRNIKDNRFCNLRLVDSQGNSINCSMCKHNTSGVRGVYWDKQMNKWAAQIKNKGRKIHLGYHIEIDDAKDAYDKAALEIHGEYAVTNSMLQEVV